jgi:hypothetical protein
MTLQEEETQQLQSPPMLIDALFCAEESFEEENGVEEEEKESENPSGHQAVGLYIILINIYYFNFLQLLPTLVGHPRYSSSPMAMLRYIAVYVFLGLFHAVHVASKSIVCLQFNVFV